MDNVVRILHLEDDVVDAELTQATLESAGMACQITRVETRDDFRQALAGGRHDAILADYSLPAYDGVSALGLARELCPDVPFIFVSGTMGEDAAIEGLTEGATDYVLKHKLSRLAPAVKRALREAENRKDRKRAEEALRRSRAELRAIYDSAPVMMCVLDNERCLLYMNRAMAAFVGKTEDELRQQRACGIIGCVNTSDDPRGCGYGPNCESCALRLALLDTLQTGRSHQDIERRMTLTRGDERPEAVLLASTALIRVGDHMNLLLCLEDITQRKSAEQAIEAARQVAEASTAQYEEVVSMISEVVWRYEVDDQTRLVKSYISPVADRLLGLPAGAIGDSFDRFFSYVHPEDSPTVQEKLLKVIQTLVKEAAVEYRACRPDGTTLWVHSSGSAHAQPDGHIVVFGTTTDITARKLAEDALRTSEERYRRIVDTANEGIWCFDAECRTTFVNRQMVAMLGYSAEEMLGRWMTEFMFEEELPDHQAEMERRKRGMGGNYERRFRRKDGTECWAAVSATSLRDRNGQFAGSFGMFADITARKTDENKLTALQAQLTHASRLATLGELAAGVAHEINQPLCTIVNFAKACKNVASDETPRLSQIRLWSDAIALAAARSGDIVRRMLGFARRGAASRETIAVEQLLDDAMLFVRHDAQSRKVAMRQEMSDSGLAVCADRVQIQQVLVNLLRNSIEAFGDARPADRQVAIQARPAGGLVQVSVSDNGLGQPEAVLPKIFEPFFTTKPQGLGLGLPISKTIIEDHGGKIWAEARQGGGLTIHFTLPARKDKPQDVPEQNGVRDR